MATSSFPAHRSCLHIYVVLLLLYFPSFTATYIELTKDCQGNDLKFIVDPSIPIEKIEKNSITGLFSNNQTEFICNSECDHDFRCAGFTVNFNRKKKNDWICILKSKTCNNHKGECVEDTCFFHRDSCIGWDVLLNEANPNRSKVLRIQQLFHRVIQNLRRCSFEKPSDWRSQYNFGAVLFNAMEKGYASPAFSQYEYTIENVAILFKRAATLQPGDPFILYPFTKVAIMVGIEASVEAWNLVTPVFLAAFPHTDNKCTPETPTNSNNGICEPSTQITINKDTNDQLIILALAWAKLVIKLRKIDIKDLNNILTVKSPVDYIITAKTILLDIIRLYHIGKLDNHGETITDAFTTLTKISSKDSNPSREKLYHDFTKLRRKELRIGSDAHKTQKYSKYALTEASFLNVTTQIYTSDVFRELMYHRRIHVQRELKKRQNTGDTNVPTVPYLVFIVGFSRSGTSMLEAMLSTIPQVLARGEIPSLDTIAPSLSTYFQTNDKKHFPPLAIQQILGRGPGVNTTDADSIASMRAQGNAVLDAKAAEFRDMLLRPPYNANLHTHITNKFPEHAWKLAVLRLLYPYSIMDDDSASILKNTTRLSFLQMIRNPLDVAVSNYEAPYSENNMGWTWQFQDIALVLSHHRKLMLHWRAIGIVTTDIRYEDVVFHPRSVMKRILKAIRLPSDETSIAECLNFHLSKRVTQTQSNQQVQQPLYSSSVGRWKHYTTEGILPLINTLSDVIQKKGNITKNSSQNSYDTFDWWLRPEDSN